MNATDPTLANILQIQGNLEHYHIPKYQREYTWGRNEWEQLLNDIEENDPGYFMGSIICIDDNHELPPGESRVYEVVDGQQRLTTLSLLLMALCYRYNEIREEAEDLDLDDEDLEELNMTLSNIKKQLIIKKASVGKTERGSFKDKDKYCFLRVQPSTQRQNLADYNQILEELGLLKGNFTSQYCGLRRIYKAYDYFYSRLPESLEETNYLLHKINSLKFIHISVSSSSDAFTLFESLNNRGVPLSVMDLIKNKMLANLEKQGHADIDEAYEEWQELLAKLPEYQDQERFLRHYYNAFKVYPEKRIDRFARATKTSLVKIYEHYIKNDAAAIFNDLQSKSELYTRFIKPEQFEDRDDAEYLTDLKRIGSSPSYLLLLYLYDLPSKTFDNKEQDLLYILQELVKYYVRRNITDFPSTRDLDAINIEVIEACQKAIDAGNKLTGTFVINELLSGKGKASSLPLFESDLEHNLFAFNAGMARYVLTKLDEVSHTREYKPDLWARNQKGLLVWTVEHIFPQGVNIRDCWINMVADGDKGKAKAIYEEYVHCLGNLTLSGYNSQLSNACFKDKQDLNENKKFLGYKIHIGYKNGLSINNLKFDYKGVKTNLAQIEEWTEDAIKSRNQEMVKILLELFKFDMENELVTA